MATLLSTMTNVLVRISAQYGDAVDAAAIADGAPGGADRAASQRIPVDRFDAAVLWLVEHTGDPHAGLKAGACWHPSDLGPLGLAWLTAQDLQSALAMAVRYARILGDRGLAVHSATRESTTFVFDPRRSDPRVDAFLAEFVLSLVLGMCRANAGAGFHPMQVTLRAGDAAFADGYARVFGCPVSCDAEANALFLPNAPMQAPLRTGNAHLAGLLGEAVAAAYAQLDRRDIVGRCRREVLQALPERLIGLEEAADRLHISQRTLQRRLADVGCTFQQVVDDVRRDLAARWLQEEKSVTEVAFLLGFSSSGSFSRAYGKWTGRKPADSRREGGRAARQPAT